MNYHNTIDKIKLIKKNLRIQNNYYEYLKEQAEFLLAVDEVRKGLKDINEVITDLNYNNSHANTEYCINKYGRQLGQFLSQIANALRKSLDFLSEEDVDQAYKYNRIFIDTYNYLTSHVKVNINDLKAIIQYTDLNDDKINNNKINNDSIDYNKEAN